MNKVRQRKILGEFQCDKCKRIFYRKWVRAQKNWTKINEISYWTEGKKWNDYKIFCRACLNDWFEKAEKDFANLVPEEKRKVFFNYRYLGALNKDKEKYKE